MSTKKVPEEWKPDSELILLGLIPCEYRLCPEVLKTYVYGTTGIDDMTPLFFHSEVCFYAEEKLQMADIKNGKVSDKGVTLH